jgi:predicted TIM-barrel fold metal-dependent hydrolase
VTQELRDGAEAVAAASALGSRPLTNLTRPAPGLNPPRRARTFTVISVDDHLAEPPHLFEGRLPNRFKDRTPRVVEAEDGAQIWLLDGSLVPQIGINAVVGHGPKEHFSEPTRFEAMRRGAWDISSRIADMNIDGVYASVSFPSMVGFAGVRIQTLADREYAFAVFRAWNDWHIEEWAGEAHGRMIPCQIPWLDDAAVAAEEVRRNAERGFRALTFPESPDRLGLSSLFSGEWDPLWHACEETRTVVCLHIGSSGDPPRPRGLPYLAMGTIMGSSAGLLTAIEWLYSGIAIRFPNLRICLSEGGIGWVPGLLDRLDHDARKHRATPQYQAIWAGSDLAPSDLLRRNFRFCMLNDPTALEVRERIGTSNVTFEVDYPHGDTSWPDTQERLVQLLARLPPNEQQMIAWSNAAELFRLDVPESVQRNPDAY